MIGSGNVIISEKEGYLGYNLAEFPVMGAADGDMLSISQQDEVTVLSLLWSPGAIDGGEVNLRYTDDTVISFLFDSEKLQQALSSSPLLQMAWVANPLWDAAMVSQGVLLGDLQVHPNQNQIVLWFTIETTE